MEQGKITGNGAVSGSPQTIGVAGSISNVLYHFKFKIDLKDSKVRVTLVNPKISAMVNNQYYTDQKLTEGSLPEYRMKAISFIKRLRNGLIQKENSNW